MITEAVLFRIKLAKLFQSCWKYPLMLHLFVSIFWSFTYLLFFSLFFIQQKCFSPRKALKGASFLSMLKNLPIFQRRLAELYHKVSTQGRVGCTYYLVGFFGSGFPSYLNGQQFVYRGNECEVIVCNHIWIICHSVVFVKFLSFFLSLYFIVDYFCWSSSCKDFHCKASSLIIRSYCFTLFVRFLNCIRWCFIALYLSYWEY